MCTQTRPLLDCVDGSAVRPMTAAPLFDAMCARTRWARHANTLPCTDCAAKRLRLGEDVGNKTSVPRQWGGRTLFKHKSHINHSRVECLQLQQHAHIHTQSLSEAYTRTYASNNNTTHALSAIEARLGGCIFADCFAGLADGRWGRLHSQRTDAPRTDGKWLI